MWALIYKLNEVKLYEALQIEDVLKEKGIIEAHVFDNKMDVLIDKDQKQIHLEDEELDNNSELHFDEKMLISNLFKSLYHSNYSFITVRNYLSFNEDGILYIKSSRLLEVE